MAIMAGSVQLSCDDKVIRLYPNRHDRCRGIGSLCRPQRPGPRKPRQHYRRDAPQHHIPRVDTTSRPSHAEPEPSAQGDSRDRQVGTRGGLFSRPVVLDFQGVQESPPRLSSALDAWQRARWGRSRASTDCHTPSAS